jgi:hypothetical protein
MKTFHESLVMGIALGASMLFLIAATPVKNLVFQGNADAGGYQITNLATGTNASNAATVGYVTNKIAEVAAPKFPVIYIPVPPGSRWTDFELKASSSNFSHDAPGFFYWYHSPDPSKSVATQQSWSVQPKVYFTDSGRADPRVWIKQNDTQSIFEMLADANSEVGGFIIVIQDDLSAYKEGLVFSYSFLDATTGENDPANRGIWRPVWPQEWVNSFDITNSLP